MTSWSLSTPAPQTTPMPGAVAQASPGPAFLAQATPAVSPSTQALGSELSNGAARAIGPGVMSWPGEGGQRYLAQIGGAHFTGVAVGPNKVALTEQGVPETMAGRFTYVGDPARMGSADPDKPVAPGRSLVGGGGAAPTGQAGMARVPARLRETAQINLGPDAAPLGDRIVATPFGPDGRRDFALMTGDNRVIVGSQDRNGDVEARPVLSNGSPEWQRWTGRATLESLAASPLSARLRIHANDTSADGDARRAEREVARQAATEAQSERIGALSSRERAEASALLNRTHQGDMQAIARRERATGAIIEEHRRSEATREADMAERTRRPSDGNGATIAYEAGPNGEATPMSGRRQDAIGREHGPPAPGGSIGTGTDRYEARGGRVVGVTGDEPLTPSELETRPRASGSTASTTRVDPRDAALHGWRIGELRDALAAMDEPNTARAAGDALGQGGGAEGARFDADRAIIAYEALLDRRVNGDGVDEARLERAGRKAEEAVRRALDRDTERTETGGRATALVPSAAAGAAIAAGVRAGGPLAGGAAASGFGLATREASERLGLGPHVAQSLGTQSFLEGLIRTGAAYTGGVLPLPGPWGRAAEPALDAAGKAAISTADEREDP
ncbi:MAG TPA: hypothetical protein VEA41_10025 [Salinarimonas sp.]|nr:hypothetical protein [Salinarimonas sp.]